MSADNYRAFIETVLGEMKGNAALALADDERTPNGRLKVNEYIWFEYPRQTAEMVDFTVANQHRDVYLLPSVYGTQQVSITRKGERIVYPKDKQGRAQWSRAKSNALTSNSIYMDSDTCPPEKFRLKPSMHVDTSEGHGHDYWLLQEPIPATLAADIAHRITTAHKADGTDPTGWSANKVLRMPTVNTKDPEHPWEITWSDSGERYVAEDVLAVYENVEVDHVPEAIDLGGIPGLDTLEDFTDLASKIPVGEKRLNELIYKEPQRGEKGWQSEQRWALILDCLRFGFTPAQTLSIVWNAPAGAKWREDDRGLAGLWSVEITKAVAQVELERGKGVMAAPEEPTKYTRAPNLLTDAERSRFNARQDFITDYTMYAASKVPVLNRPLHASNAWIVLSLAFGEVAYIPKSSEPMPLNIFVMQFADSSTGKSEAKGLMFSVVNKLYPADHPDIGGNFSANALVERLLERQNQISLINMDEAQGRIAEWKNGGWQTGMPDLLAHIYDGKLPQLGRVGRKELRAPDARTIPVMHMSGTQKGMMRVLDHAMFTSGFMPRQIMVIGETVDICESDLMPKQTFGEDVQRVYEQMPNYWSSIFFRTRAKIRADLPAGQRQMPVHLTDEAAKRMGKARWAILNHFQEFPQQEIYRPAVNRMNDIIWKVAALLALSEGHYVITEAHVISAIGYAEEWLENLITVAEGISETAFSRALEDIERAIAMSKGGELELGAVYRLRKGEPTRYVDEYLTALKKQGRISEEHSGGIGGKTFYKIRRAH